MTDFKKASNNSLILLTELENKITLPEVIEIFTAQKSKLLLNILDVSKLSWWEGFLVSKKVAPTSRSQMQFTNLNVSCLYS